LAFDQEEKKKDRDYCFEKAKNVMVVLDTNIIIDHLRRENQRDSLLIRLAKEKPKEALALSMISVQELYEGSSTRNEKREQHLLATISPLRILPYTYEVAVLAGSISRDRKTPIELADAAIAATAIIHGGVLYTLNRKDFSGIPDLQLGELDKFDH